MGGPILRAMRFTRQSSVPLAIAGRMRPFGWMALAVALAGLPACDTAPGDVREWTPADHDQPANAGGDSRAAQAPRSPAAAASGRPGEAGGDPELVELAWQKNCVQCHGPAGHGDGPQGPMLRAPDLSRPDWQDRVTDAEMLETIRRGRNKMPAFDLPRPVLEGLVRGIRGLRHPSPRAN
jgi:mono/diheme cytochrome c family protein